jgi:hypothetical protein
MTAAFLRITGVIGIGMLLHTCITRDGTALLVWFVSLGMFCGLVQMVKRA